MSLTTTSAAEAKTPDDRDDNDMEPTLEGFFDQQNTEIYQTISSV